MPDGELPSLNLTVEIIMDQTKRVALVIGNSHYGDGNDVSGVEDANAMAQCLRELGFIVLTPLLDGEIQQMNDALTEFKEQIRGSSVALFFYSGHGFQAERKNYLVPTDGDIIPARAVALDHVLQRFVSAPNAKKFVFLDACRDEKRLPQDALKGLADPGPAPSGILQAFAASPGQLAASGSADGLSPYTTALVRYLREPGLKLPELLAKVHADVLRDTPRRQHTFVAGAIPENFYFRDPVFVKVTTYGWPTSPILVILNGEVVLTTNEASVTDLRLKAGENELVLMVSHGKTYHNGQVWGRTESWSYKLDLELPKDENGESETVTFEGREDVPFKDGPHHGQTFIVAQAKILVDPQTAKVTVANKDTDIAFSKIPFWAQDQEILFQAKLVDLNLSPDDVLGDAVKFNLLPILRPILADFLKTGRVLGNLVADPNKTFVAVRGNKALRSVAQHCMTQGWPDRLRDLRASFAAFFNDRNPRPFDVFAEGLDACIRANASRLGIDLKPEDLRVWTSLDDLSPASPQVVTPGDGTPEALDAPAASAPTAVSDESLMAMAQDAVLLPRQDEVLLDTRSLEQDVQGVRITAQVYTFLSIEILDDKLKLHARAIADLSDFQNKIGALIDTIPLPTDNCSHFGVDNVVARIWGKQITVNGDVATLKLNGDVEIWTCAKNPIPCTRIEWDEKNILGAIIRVPRTVFYDCNPPIKNRNLSQPFEATLPFRLAPVDSQTFALRLGDPSVNLGGALGSVTEGILRIAGVDINAKVKEALDRAVNPEVLKQSLPEFLLKYNPALTRAELLSNSGALALTLEMEAILDAKALGELIQEFLSRQ